MSQRFQFHTQLFLEHFPFQRAIRLTLLCNESGTLWAAATAGLVLLPRARAGPAPGCPHHLLRTHAPTHQLCATGTAAPLSPEPRHRAEPGPGRSWNSLSSSVALPALSPALPGPRKFRIMDCLVCLQQHRLQTQQKDVLCHARRNAATDSSTNFSMFNK